MENNFLELLNNKLNGFDGQIKIKGSSSHHNIFIIGAPRSGTTLLSQLFSGCTDVGYPNNLMAMFWSAPLTGALLSKKFITDKVFTGSSKYGRTSDFREPHEFGAFWRSNLLMPDMDQPNNSHKEIINWNHLADTLMDITRIFSLPVVYKAFHLVWFIKEISTVLPNSKWIWIKRKTTNNARSLLDLRRYLNNDINVWASSKPIGMENYISKNPYLEVVAQVELINSWINSQLSGIDEKNSYSLSLESLTSNPVKTFYEISSWSGVNIIDENLEHAIKNIQAETFKNDYEYKHVKDAYNEFLKYENN